MSKSNRELAHIAYQAYGAVTDFKNYQGLPMPAFDDLPPNIQTAWDAACAAVASTVGAPAAPEEVSHAQARAGASFAETGT